MTQEEKDTKMKAFQAAWHEFFTTQMQCASVQELAEKTQNMMFDMWAFIHYTASGKSIDTDLKAAFEGLLNSIYYAVENANMARKLAEKSNI